MEHRVLYLGSSSQSRQRLLTIAEIPYEVLTHDSDECVMAGSASFEEYVLAVAQEKMRHVTLPPKAPSPLYVLTADTLVSTEVTRQVLGKPIDKADAKRMLRLLRSEPANIATGCCLEKKEKVADGWQTIAYRHWSTVATIEYCVDEESLEKYLEKVPMALHACGAGIIEGYGHNFLKSIQGSYSAVLGLPMYELRQELKNMGFYRT